MIPEYNRIFAALDGQSTQRVVAQKAVRIASASHAELRFGHVVDAVPTEASAVNFKDLCGEFKRQIEEALADVFKAAEEDENIPKVELVVEAGSINETLDRDLIEPYNPDLVICGERGLSKIKYAFVGSVSTHLIRTLRCDVLVIKQD